MVPPIPSGPVRTVRRMARIIAFDTCDPSFACMLPSPLQSPGPPVRAEPAAFRHLLRFVHTISFEQLARLISICSACDQRGALAGCSDSRPAFTRQRSLIRARLLAGNVLQSDETSAGSASGTGGCRPHQVSVVASSSCKPRPDMVAQFLGDVRPAFWVSDRFERNWAGPVATTRSARPSHPRTPGMPSTPAIYSSMHALRRACAIGATAGAGYATLRTYRYKLDAELDPLLQHSDPYGRRPAEGCRRFLFTFLANRAIPPTNNGSAQALRPCVVYRKVTNCFRWNRLPTSTPTSLRHRNRPSKAMAFRRIRETLNGSPLVEMRSYRQAAQSGNQLRIDLESYRRWYQYSTARDVMLKRRIRFAPWTSYVRTTSASPTQLYSVIS